MDSTPAPPDMPPHWRSDLAGYRWTAQTIGRSTAAVYRLEAEGKPTLFVKTELTDAFSELPDEAMRLRWLTTSGIACPAVLRESHDDARNWLLMQALPGRDLASSPQLTAQQIVTIAADALRGLHRLDPSTCPFDQRLESRIADAEARMKAGAVDESDFDDERSGWPVSKVFDELVRRRPAREDLVVTHGDACLPNLMAAAGHFSGFIDCARLGVADRHQDLALTSWSIHYNLGENWVAPFLHRYGMQVDPDLLSFYRLLDEFF
ncbi:MAG TPA: APH(3')-II family aminoglycoside O-phosphotransferase [Beijerinckiaceae bacterium]|jgi:aminoglycoside 3'-phosphotransferase-2|nr:APH(3')-II family aminoglycoside O-phosphotransferase [Beijerinckiaceae bacterium]